MTAMPAASESLFTRGLRVLGAKRLHAQLAAHRLTDYVPAETLPEEMRGLSALDCLDYLWPIIGRPEQQIPPGDWTTWLVQCGRGWGKTRTGAEATLEVAQEAARLIGDGRLAREEAKLAAIASTSSDARDVLVEGPGGLLRCAPPWFEGNYEPSKKKISYPGGVEVHLFSSEEPDRLRGPQFIWLWCDEFCAWQHPGETLDNAMMGLRLGPHPRCLITTTPRPSARLKRIIGDPHTVVTRGATRDNIRNLAPSAVERLYATYGNTRLGRQELEGEVLTDNPGALWKMAQIDAARIATVPELKRIVVAIDPAVTSRADSDETGIVVAGVGRCTCQGAPADHGFVLADRSGIYTPDAWARAVVSAYEVHGADRVIAEVNNGGELVEATIRTIAPSIPYKAVHASRGKAVRAEPIAALYEQGKVHHVGSLAKLEDQLTQWDPAADSRSPDRLDAVVWALTDLMPARSSPILGLRW